MPLHSAGARILELFQIGMVQGNVSVGVLSYAGQLNFDIVGDADACPDLAVFAAGISEALQELGVGVPLPRASGRHPHRQLPHDWLRLTGPGTAVAAPM